METALIVVIAILSLLVIGLFIVAFVFFFKYLKLREERIPQAEESKLNKIPKEIQEAIEHAKSIGANLVGRHCVDHPELPAKGTCSISNEIYCELCLTKENDVKIARKFLSLLLDNEWDHLYMINNEFSGADKINELMRVKKNLWKEQEIPVITQQQFKINIENDKIEAYTVVMAREQDSELVKKTLNFLETHDDTISL